MSDFKPSLLDSSNISVYKNVFQGRIRRKRMRLQHSLLISMHCDVIHISLFKIGIYTYSNCMGTVHFAMHGNLQVH